MTIGTKINVIYNIEINFIILDADWKEKEQIEGLSIFFKNNKYEIIREAMRPICCGEPLCSTPICNFYQNHYSVGMSLSSTLTGKSYSQTLPEYLKSVKENVEKAITDEFSYMPAKLIVRVDFYENKFWYPIIQGLRNLFDRMLKSYNKSLIL